MLGYMCNRCLSIHDEVPKRFYKDDDGDSEVWICPKCGDEDNVVEVELCPMCESERAYEDMGLCLTCAQKATSSDRLSDALREIALMPVNKEIAK